MKVALLGLIGTVFLFGCSFSDPKLDKEIAKYRGTGIQQQGNVMPPHELEDVEH